MVRIVPCVQLLCVLLLAAAIPSHFQAQEPELPAVRGNITAVQLPDGFDVDGFHVIITTYTQFFAYKGPKKDESELRREIATGSYVQVIGTKNRKARTVTATQIKIRDDRDFTVSGIGVIDRVISPGTEPLFHADGNILRLDTKTEVRFSGGLTALNEVSTGIWIHYEGRRNDAGEVIPTHVEFVKPKLPKRKASLQGFAQVTTFSAGSLIDFDGRFSSAIEKHRMADAGGACGWYPVPDIEAMQTRVRSIGQRLIPQFQRDLPEDDPAKIPFRFYVVEEKYIRSALFCNEGLVLIPVHVMERIENDDQLAAVIADGVAANLQRQQARVEFDMKLIGAAEVAVYLAVRSGVGFGAGEVGGAIVMHEVLRKMEQQRGRVALGLMADAGFDPWQAPEAWRLLDPKQMPKDPAKLKYPERSGYQLEMLNLQYRKSSEARSSPPAPGSPSRF
ncbi:DUF5666 domain-containing protein [Telmatobacter sp. DSM 110680]|uniref:DUF5666 domain-containing protein n=1 Tax=Telmatobacter sp. DSM 110680 TaxID=3036704 RepID=A0AAU7DR89_9BACT